MRSLCTPILSNSVHTMSATCQPRQSPCPRATMPLAMMPQATIPAGHNVRRPQSPQKLGRHTAQDMPPGSCSLSPLCPEHRLWCGDSAREGSDKSTIMCCAPPRKGTGKTCSHIHSQALGYLPIGSPPITPPSHPARGHTDALGRQQEGGHSPPIESCPIERGFESKRPVIPAAPSRASSETAVTSH